HQEATGSPKISKRVLRVLATKPPTWFTTKHIKCVKVPQYFRGLTVRGKKFVSTVFTVLAAMLASAGVFTAEKPSDPTVATAPVKYVPKLTDLSYTGVNAGDAADADFQALGTDVAYMGLVLNGDGVNPSAPHLFLKLQQ